MKTDDILRKVQDACVHWDGVLTSRRVPLRAMRRLEKLGYVEPAGLLLVCDGDGFAMQPERYRHGWRITPMGVGYLYEIDPNSEAQMQAIERLVDEVDQ